MLSKWWVYIVFGGVSVFSEVSVFCVGDLCAHVYMYLISVIFMCLVMMRLCQVTSICLLIIIQYFLCTLIYYIDLIT